MFDDTKLRIKIIKSVNFRIQRSGVEYTLDNVGWIWAVKTPPRSLPNDGYSGILWSTENYVVVFTTARDLNGWWPETAMVLTHWENENWRPCDPQNPPEQYLRKIQRRGGQGKRGPDSKPRIPREKANYVRDNRPLSEKVALVKAAHRKGITGRSAVMKETGITSATYYKIIKILDSHYA